MWKRLFLTSLLLFKPFLGKRVGTTYLTGKNIYTEICCPEVCCPPTCSTPCSPFPVLLVDLQGGVRRDSFSFSVSGKHGHPNPLLTQKYTKIKSAMGGVNVWFQIDRQWYVRGFADYASINHGKEKQNVYNSNGALIQHYEANGNSGCL